MSRDRCFFESASLILELSRFFLFSDSKWRGESSEKTHRVTQLINSLETIRIVFSATCCIQRDEILWRFCIAAVLIERPTEMAPSRKRNRDCRNRVLRRVFFLVVREFICANVRVRDSSSQKKKRRVDVTFAGSIITRLTRIFYSRLQTRAEGGHFIAAQRYECLERGF